MARAEAMGFQLHVNNALTEHDNAADITFLPRRGEVKQEPAPYPDTAITVPLEPEAAKVDGIVQQHDIHFPAVMFGRLEYRILDGLGPPPVPDGKAGQKQPEERSESHNRFSCCFMSDR